MKVKYLFIAIMLLGIVFVSACVQQEQEVKTINDILDSPVDGEEVFVEGRFAVSPTAGGQSIPCLGKELGPDLLGIYFEDKTNHIWLGLNSYVKNHSVFKDLERSYQNSTIWVKDGYARYLYIALKAKVKVYNGPVGCSDSAGTNLTIIYLDVNEIQPKPSFLQGFYNYLWGGGEADRKSVENIVEFYSGGIECAPGSVDVFVGGLNGTHASATYRITSGKTIRENDNDLPIRETCSASYSFELKRDYLIWRIVNVSLKGHSTAYDFFSGRQYTESELVELLEVEKYLKSYKNDLECDSEDTVRRVRSIKVNNSHATATLILHLDKFVEKENWGCDVTYSFELEKTGQEWHTLNYILRS